MIFKVVRIDTTNNYKIKLPLGIFTIGRGHFKIDEVDKKISRKHAQLEVTTDTLTLKSLHKNPCFYIKDGKETQILRQDCSVELSNGNKFGLLPETFWYEVLQCPDEDPNESNKDETVLVPNGPCENDDVRTSTSEDEAHIDQVRSVPENANTIRVSPQEPSVNSAITPTKRNNSSMDASPVNIKKVKMEPVDVSIVKSEPMDTSSVPVEVQIAENTLGSVTVKVEPVDSSSSNVNVEPDTRNAAAPSNNEPGPSNNGQSGNNGAPASPVKPAARLRERCFYGANCYSNVSRRRVSYSQLNQLCEFLSQNKAMATGNNKSAQAREYSTNMWKNIAINLNSYSDGAKKDWKDWWKYWNDYKSKLRKLAAAYRACHKQPGGDTSQIKPITDIEIKFLQILGDDIGDLPGLRIQQFAQDAQETEDTGVEGEGGYESISTLGSVQVSEDGLFLEINPPVAPSFRSQSPNDGASSSPASPNVDHSTTGASVEQNSPRPPRRRRRRFPREPSMQTLVDLIERRARTDEDNSRILKHILIEIRQIKQILRSRRNPDHREQFCHPDDSDWGSGEQAQCPYGSGCRRRDPRHWQLHSHPDGTTPPGPRGHPPGMRRVERHGNIYYINAHTVNFYDDHFETEDSDGDSVDYDFEF